MAILNRIRAALNPSVTLEDLEGENVATPFRDLGEYFAAGFGVQTRKAKERRSQLEAQKDFELGQIDGRVASELETLAGMDPESESHRSIVSGLADRAAIVSTQLASPFADMRAAGIEELSALMQEIHVVGLEVEKRRIRDAEIEAAGLKEDFDAYNTLYDDLYRESSDFIERRDSYNALAQSYARGIGEDQAGNANDIAAINSLQRMIDPGVSVREGDVSLLANLAGVPDLLVTAANRVANEGARFTPQQRLELLRLGNDIIAGANQEQTARNGRFQQTARISAVDDSFVRQLGIPIAELRELPGMAGRPGAPTTLPDQERQARDAGRTAGKKANELGSVFRSAAAGFIEGAMGMEEGTLADSILGRPIRETDRPMTFLERAFGVNQDERLEENRLRAVRGALEDALAEETNPEEQLRIRMDLRVLDAAEGRERHIGTIQRPTN